MIKGKTSPEQYKISELMNKVKLGEFHIPPFQRDFVWNADKIMKLLQSIKKGYPIGVLTTSSSSSSKAFSGKNLILDSIANNNFKSTGLTLVDGQQRTTSLVIVWYIVELLMEKETIVKKDKKLFDLINKIGNNILFVEGILMTAATFREQHADYERRHLNDQVKKYSISTPEVNELIREMMEDYVIHVQNLEGWDEKSIVWIFSAMNQGAKPLTHIDLLNSYLYQSDSSFDLLARLKDSNKQWENFGKISHELFVQLIKIYVDLKIADRGKVDISKDSILKFGIDVNLAPKFINDYNGFEEHVKKTISLLDTKLDIYSMDFLPKNVYMQVVFAAALLKRGKELDSLISEAISLVTKRLILRHYSSSPGTKAQNDINHGLIRIAHNLDVEYMTEQFRDDEDRNSEKDWFELAKTEFADLTYKNKNQAMFKLGKSIMAKNKPRMLFEDGYVPLRPTETTPTDYDIHHFVPTNSRSVKNNQIFKTIPEQFGNFVLITSDENKNVIRNKDIHDYLEQSRKKIGKEFPTTMKSHMFDPKLIEEFMKVSTLDKTKQYLALSKLLKDRRNTIVQKVIDKYIK